MELEIQKEQNTPLLSRKRVTMWATFEKETPSRMTLKQEVAKKVGAKEDLVIIKHIYQRYGGNRAKVMAHVYDNAEAMNKIEQKKLVDKHVVKKEEAPAEEKPAEAAPASEEAPKEEEKPAEEAPATEEKKEEEPAKEESSDDKKEEKSE